MGSMSPVTGVSSLSCLICPPLPPFRPRLSMTCVSHPDNALQFGWDTTYREARGTAAGGATPAKAGEETVKVTGKNSGEKKETKGCC